jgi:hypothetical protein
MAVMAYRTRNGLDDYGFSIEFEPRHGWRVYIVFVPFHDSNGKLRLPHLAVDSQQRRYVDWPSELKNLGDAQTVAALWAELIERY